MKKLVLLLITACLLITGCKKEESKFSFDEKYYHKSEFIELEKENLNKLIKDKESFGIFIYQPLCSNSYEFNKVLTEFSKKYQISFYKMSYSNMKETNLGDSIKYYPSLVIFKDGKMIDFLDANSNEDTDYYKTLRGLKKWFSKYVNIEETYINNTNTSGDSETETNTYTKIDTLLENIVYDENKVNIYFFWGDGCPHCKEEFKFFESIKTEYGDYFTLNSFEVWHNDKNQDLLKQFAGSMGDEVSEIPYTIIGNKTFTGFGESHEKEILEAIKEQYKNSYDVYFDKKS